MSMSVHRCTAAMRCVETQEVCCCWSCMPPPCASASNHSVDMTASLAHTSAAAHFEGALLSSSDVGRLVSCCCYSLLLALSVHAVAKLWVSAAAKGLPAMLPAC